MITTFRVPLTGRLWVESFILYVLREENARKRGAGGERGSSRRRRVEAYNTRDIHTFNRFYDHMVKQKHGKCSRKRQKQYPLFLDVEQGDGVERRHEIEEKKKG